MIYKIFEQDAETLLKKTETGMGYQIVEASQYQSNKVRKFVIYNTNLAVELNSDFQSFKQLIIKNGYHVILNKVPELMLETNSIKVFPHYSVFEFKMLSELKKTKNKRHSGGKGATENRKNFASGIDIFVRVSAYEDDKRIDFEKKRLKPGSFTTTLDDYLACVNSNDNPIDRYALPNDETIKWSFHIKPKSIDFYK